MLLLLIDFILIGGILPLIERKFLALVQRRVGPNYLGYKGRFQFIADALKVFFKEYFYLAKTNNVQYLTMPLNYFSLTLFFIFLFFFDSNLLLYDNNYSIIFFYIILIYTNLILFFSGIITKNKFAIISANRVSVFIFTLDIVFSCFLLLLIMFAGSFSLVHIKDYKFFNIISPHVFFIIPIIFLIFLIDSNKAPFDMFEAESELVMGYSTEYGGFLFGLYILTEYIHIYFFSFLIYFCLFIFLLNLINYFLKICIDFYDNFFSLFFFFNFVMLMAVVMFYNTENTLKKCMYLYLFLFLIIYFLFLFEIHQYFGFLIFTETTLIFFLCNLCLVYFNLSLKNKKKNFFIFLFIFFFFEKKKLSVNEYYTDYIGIILNGDLNDFSSVFFLFEFNFLFIFFLLNLLFVTFFVIFRSNNFFFFSKKKKKERTVLKSFNIIFTSIFKPSIKKFK